MPTVLIVDDSAVDRRLAGGLLESKTDWEVVYATNGQDAVDQLHHKHADVVVTDMVMPEMDGLELVVACRNDYPLIPVILMTAKGSESVAAEALRMGAASYLPKRRLALDLVRTIDRVLATSHEDRSYMRLMHRMNHYEAEFVLGTDPSLISSLVSHLQQMIRSLPLGDETERLRVGIALYAALENALYHGSLEIGAGTEHDDESSREALIRQRCQEAPYVGRRVFVNVEISRTMARYVVRDEGPGFDHSTVPDANLPTNLESQSGRGLMLMQTFMDEVSFNDVGNEVTLVKRAAPESDEEPANDES